MKRVKVRGAAVAFVIGALLLALIGRLYRIQQINESYYQRLAERQHRGVETLEPVRGRIYTADGRVLASSLLVDSVYVDSQFVGKQAETALTLQRALCLSPKATSTLFKRIRDGRRFIWVKRRISDREKEILVKLDIPGVFFQKEYKRYYPGNEYAAHISGFCDVDDIGRDGIELFYNKYLTGTPGKREFERDACGNKITKTGMLDIPQIDGHHIYLTIDSVVQHIVEKAIEDTFEEWKPVWATAVVLDVKSGEVLGMSSRPTFDPNKPGLATTEQRRNVAICDMYEPGSTFKPVTFAGLFNEKLVRLDEKVFCEEGKWKIGRRTLRDHKPHGWLSVLEVIAKSSNIGTAKCAQRMESVYFDRYMRNFGFGSKLGIDLPGEASGQLRNVAKWSKYSHDSLCMGQEINVTALQITAAFAAIANGGEFYEPRILKRVADEKGNVVYERENKAVRRVVSKESTRELIKAMVEVVETGTGTRVKSDKFMIAGKTGTAQKQIPGVPGYAPGKFYASFCGFAPATNPQICVLVVVNDPDGWSHYGGTVAGPAVKEIIEQTLMYMRIPEDRIKEDADRTAQNSQEDDEHSARR